MKSKVLAALVATMAVGATCAFAANPFVDVPSDSWAYKSVVELADAGIIQGVDGQYFQGERNITRYEAAEMVAKAMAHQDKATVEQRALINKLADEYADELNNLGVRVSALENKVGNVKLSGDARLRYLYQNDQNGKGGVNDDASWSYRIRLRADAQVNDNTVVRYGISTDNVSFANPSAASDSDNNPYTDRAEVVTKLGSNVTASVGRTDAYVLGNTYGYNYGNVFDRAQLKYANDSFAVTAGYGKFKESKDTDMLNTKTGYGEIEGFFGKSAVGAYYNSFNGKDSIIADDLWGAYASLGLGQKWNLLANYENVSLSKDNAVTGDDSADLWIGKLTYGKASMATPKSWDAWVEYIDAEAGSYLGAGSNSWRFGQMDNIQSWGAGVDYTFAKNAQFNVMQSFASSTKDGSNQDPEEQTRAQFVFAF